MTIKEIMDNYDGEFSAVEVFESKNNRRSFHTDQIQALDDSMYSLSAEAIDYELMDKEDYNRTICANSSISFSDAYEDDDIVLVILVQPERELTYIHVGAPAPRYAINSISRVCLLFPILLRSWVIILRKKWTLIVSQVMSFLTLLLANPKPVKSLKPQRTI